METIRELLGQIPQHALWLIGGIIAEIILQIIKRYIWQPADEQKIQKLLAAAITATAIGIITAPALSGLEIAKAALAVFFAAIGYHEATDKIGAKSLYQQLFTLDDMPDSAKKVG